MVALAAATCGIRRIGIRFCQVELLLAHHAFFGEPRSPLIVCAGLQGCGLRFFQIGLGRNQIGLSVGQISFGLQQRTLEEGRIDLRDHLSFFYPRIEVGIQARNGARNLRTHLDRGHGIDGARGLDHLAISPRSTLVVKYCGLSLPLN